MRLWAGTSKNFIEDTVRNQIAEKLRCSFFDYFRYNPSDSEVHSWNNSLVRMKDVIEYSGLTDHGILLEYQLPLSSKRLDCMVCGRNNDGLDNAVIVEPGRSSMIPRTWMVSELNGENNNGEEWGRCLTL